MQAYFPGDRVASPRDDYWTDAEAVAATLEGITGAAPQAWVVLDHAHGEGERRGAITSWFDRWGSRASDLWFGTYQVIGYVPYVHPQGSTATTVGARFGGQLELVGWWSGATLRQGQPLRVALRWRSLGAVTKDYKVFLHLVDEGGEAVAQRDRPLSLRGELATQWPSGTEVQEAYDVIVPAEARPGRYRVLVGLYDPASGDRLGVTVPGLEPADSVSLGEWTLSPSGS
jgi:hypothetical protein